MKKFAIVGLGFIFPRHKKAIESIGGSIMMTCDIDKSTNPGFTDWVEMFHDPRMEEIDTVVILTPNYLHSVMCREGVLLGKRVICEKPLTIYEDFTGLQDVHVVAQLRHNTKVEEIKKQPGKKRIDIYVKTYRDPAYFESWKGNALLSGGILYNMGIHYIDLLVHLLCDDNGECMIAKSLYTDFLASGEIEFGNGTGTYHIELSKIPCETERRMIVNGGITELQGATIPLHDKQGDANLHIKFYESIVRGESFSAFELAKTLILIKELHKKTLCNWPVLHA